MVRSRSTGLGSIAEPHQAGCLKLYKSPIPAGEAGRASFVEEAAAAVSASLSVPAGNKVRPVLELFSLIERGCRTVLKHLGGLPASNLTPEREPLRSGISQRSVARQSARASHDAIVLNDGTPSHLTSAQGIRFDPHVLPAVAAAPNTTFAPAESSGMTVPATI
jgi:hypothetical protein